jgi:hypothetical protein
MGGVEATAADSQLGLPLLRTVLLALLTMAISATLTFSTLVSGDWSN